MASDSCELVGGPHDGATINPSPRTFRYLKVYNEKYYALYCLEDGAYLFKKLVDVDVVKNGTLVGPAYDVEEGPPDNSASEESAGH